MSAARHVYWTQTVLDLAYGNESRRPDRVFAPFNYSLPDLTKQMRCMKSIKKRTEKVILRPVKEEIGGAEGGRTCGVRIPNS